VYQHSHYTSKSGRFVDRLRLQCTDYCRSGGRLCRSNTIPESRLRPIVLDAVAHALAHPSLFLEARDQQQNTAEARQQLAHLDTELAGFTTAWNRWSDLFERGGITPEEMLDHRQRILGQRSTLQHQRDTIANDLDRAEGARQTVEALSGLLSTLPDLPDPELRTIYQQMIRNIIVTKKENIAILWW